jgi:hypothetical protein
MSIALILLADDYGRGRANHSWLGGQVFPSKDDATELVAEALRELTEMRYVILYHVRGQSYFEIRNWGKHQRVDKPGKPRVPPPGEEQTEAPTNAKKAVYFVQGESTGLIKIGESVDPVSRVTELAKCGSENLLLLAIVANGSRTERELHAKLSGSRIHGEWFNPTPEVLNEVKLAGGDAYKPLARFGYDSERKIREPFRSDSGTVQESFAPDLRPTTMTNDREGTDAHARVLEQTSDSGLLGSHRPRFTDTECPDEIEPLPKTVALIAEQKLPPVADLLDVFISSRRKVGARCANWREDFHGFVRKWNLNEMRSDKKRADSEPVRRTITYEDLTPTREQTLERNRLLREAKARGAAERAAKAALAAGCSPVAIGAQNEATTPEAPRQ